MPQQPLKQTRILLLATLLLTSCATSPIELSLWKNIQLFDQDTPIVGARLGVTSVNKETHGIDIGLLATITDQGSGINVAYLVKSDHHTGLQIAMASHTLRTDGILIAWLGNPLVSWEERPRETMVNGAQVGLFGSRTNELNGVQLSMIANVANDVDGLQVALANKAKRVGLGSQVGLVNIADRGLQIGLLNFNKNGFLPFFPLINF
jgi:hypothetical protein